MKRKREIIVQKNEEGQRVDNWLAKRYTYHPLEKWIEYINRGMIKINELEVSPDYIIKNSDKVIYYPEPIIEPPINRNYITVYEDENLLVINKPSDIPCHPGGIYFENTLWYILKEKYEYISLINRLDRETSGVMLIAKNKESAKFYFNQMMDRKIEKIYLVLVHGEIKDKLSGRGYLVPAINSKIRKKRDFIYDPSAKQPDGEGDPNRQFSHTEFEPLVTFDNLTLLKCKILTGRTHQIRATISSLGYPVVGDKIYGVNEDYFFKFINDELTKEDWCRLKLENQALHSWKTTLPLINGDIKEFTATIPTNWSVPNIKNY